MWEGQDLSFLSCCSTPSRRIAGRGFSLAEVVLSIGLLSVILLSVFAMFTQGMHILSHSKQVDSATEKAQECLEAIRVLGAATVAEGIYDSNNGDTPTSSIPLVPYSPTSEDYRTVVEATMTGAPAGTMAVRVDVYYERDRKVSLETYFSL